MLLYKSFILLVGVYDTEAFRVFEKKLLSEIFGPVHIGDYFGIRTNKKLYDLVNEIDVVQRINIKRLRWFGHLVQMEQNVPARRVFDYVERTK